MDTDIGGDIDDAICLAYLLKEPACELCGITTVCGEADKRAMIADAICETVHANVPVVAGSDMPLQQIPLYPTPEGAHALARWAHKEYVYGDAVSFMYEGIRNSPHEITLIGIGSMTNIAMLFTKHPDAAAMLNGLYVMNGYFGAECLPEAYYNWNSWADPLASEIVFSSTAAIHRAVTLEVTDRLTLEADTAKELFHTDSSLMQAVFDFGSAWLEKSDKFTLHDPLAAVSVFHHDVCSFARGFVDVETVNSENMGATTFTESKAGNVEISKSVNTERFYEILRGTINP